MKLKCPISSISYKCEGLGGGTAPHPIFYLEVDVLINQQLELAMEGKLDSQNLHLFCCALLHKLPVVWEVALENSELSQYQWRRNIEKLAALALRYDSRKYPEVPCYHIDHHNNTLHNLDAYLESLSQEINAQTFYTSETPQHEIDAAETEILRIIKQALNKSEKEKTLPKLMADWADSVALFPSCVSEHWKGIIQTVFKTKNYVEILDGDTTKADVEELIEHFESNVFIGSMQSLLLIRKLRAAYNVLEEFTSPAPLSHIEIVQHHDDLANALIGGSSASEVQKLKESKVEENVPVEPPLRKNFKTTGAYIVARNKWKRAQQKSQR